MRRVVITGMGAITPLGANLETSWKRLIAGQSGVRAITQFDVENLPVKIGAYLPWSAEPTAPDVAFCPTQYVDERDLKRMDRFIIMGLAAAEQALTDAGWKPTEVKDRDRTGVIMGSGIGGLDMIMQQAYTYRDHGVRRVTPFFIPGSIINLAAGQISIKYGFRGPNGGTVNACASGANAIGDAFRMIRYGDADVMVAGGAEASVNTLSMAGFIACRALSSKYNETPEKASRPWDKDRDGFILGEGAGIMVLEELEHARARGARIYAEVLGYGMASDGYHMTAPDPEGYGAMQAMRNALADARIMPDQIDYINAHGTSTPAGDMVEHDAVATVFSGALDRLSMSSTKSAIGHLLGAAGAVESIFSVLSMRDQIVPPTLNLDTPEDGIRIDLTPHVASRRKVQYTLSNSFAFGGANVTLIFGPQS